LEWRKLLNERFANNLALHKKVKATDAFNKKQKEQNLTDGDNKTYWAASKNTCEIEVDLGKTTNINFVEISEYIALGQRVKAFEVDVFENGKWKNVAKETTIGYKRILKIEPTDSNKVRIKITDAKAEVILNEVKVF
jgi:alpha-L-fucosidase